MTPADRIAWRNAVACGLLWGAAVTLAVSLTQPIGDLGPAEMLIFMAGLAPIWLSAGMVWAIGSMLADRRRSPWPMFPLVLVVAWIVSSFANYIPVGGNYVFSSSMGPALSQLSLLDIVTFHFWPNLFYGGLYFTGYVATRQALRLQRRLAALRIARNETDSQVREVRLQAIRGQIQPAMLLDALDGLHRAYATDARAGDNLFDLLVAFLRAAMPGLRTGVSTLAAELEIVRHYSRLRSALATGSPRAGWMVTVEDPAVHVAFPALRLLPALDQISRAMPHDAILEINSRQVDETYLLQIGLGPGQRLDGRQMRRLQIGVRRDLGRRWLHTTGLDDALIAELRIPVDGHTALTPRLQP